jgi:uncharacterized membrane protein HdeD (DUF308 family)
MTNARKGLLAWTAIVVPMWIVLILCTHWEPVAHDGWGHWIWHRTTGLSVDNLFEFAKGTYVHNNPRLGQVLTLLVYTPGPWHSIVTPLFELGLFWLLALLVLGRVPSLRRADDALLFAAIVALSVITVPSIGMMLFYRPFTGNYLFGLVINLALVVPYRLHYESARRAGWWWIPLLFVVGVAAGLSNEHTGPAFAALLAFALFAFWRRDRRVPAWGVAGLLGLVAGGIALFLAPGQDIRYNALATQASTLGRLIDRGFYDNAKIIVIAVLYLLPALLAVALAIVARYRDRPPLQPRTRTVAELVGGAVSLAITLTLLLSPKQGPRLYLATMVIACAAIAGWVVAQLVSRWSRAIAVAMIAAVLLYAGYRMTSAYSRLGREFRERIVILDAAPDHSVAEIPVYSVKRTRWSLGDDLLIDNIRNLVSASFMLALVKMKADGAPTGPTDEP